MDKEVDKSVEYEELLKRVEQNDPTLTEVCFDNDCFKLGYFDKMCNLICKNMVIKIVTFYEVYFQVGEGLAKILETNRSITQVWIFKTTVGGQEGLKLIFNALKKNRSVEYFDMENIHCNIVDSCIEILTDVIVNNNTLRGIGFKDLDISSEGVIMLMKSLEFNTTLEELSLPEYRAEAELQYISNMLRTNKTIKLLDIGNIVYSPSTKNQYKELCESLANNSTVDHFLIEVSGSPKAVKHFANCIKINKTLTSFDFRFDNIFSKDDQIVSDNNRCLKWFTDAIRVNSTLEDVSICIMHGEQQEGWALTLSNICKSHPTLKEFVFVVGTDRWT